MELINEKLLDIHSPDSLDAMQLSFSNEPISIGVATRINANNKLPIYVVYSNNERGYRDWEEEFSDALSAVDFAKKMWRGMKKAYAKFEHSNRTTDVALSLPGIKRTVPSKRDEMKRLASRLVRSTYLDKKHQIFVSGKLKEVPRKDVSSSVLKIAANKSKQTVVDGSSIFPVVEGTKKKNS